MMISPELFSFYLIGFLIIMLFFITLKISKDGPWSKPLAKIRVRTEQHPSKNYKPSQEEATILSPIEWLLWILLILIVGWVFLYP